MLDLIVVYFLMTHFIADFLLQTHNQAVNKSSSNKWLISHTITYSGWWLLSLSTLGVILYIKMDFGVIAPIFVYMWVYSSVGFVLITFVAHTITDYFTSRWSRKWWNKAQTIPIPGWHNFFAVIGFDQLLHILQLYFTFKIVFT